MVLLWESQKMNAIIWVQVYPIQVYPTPKMAEDSEDNMKRRTIAFFIQQLSWQVLALAGQETPNHIVQSLIELLPQVPGFNDTSRQESFSDWKFEGIQPNAGLKQAS